SAVIQSLRVAKNGSSSPKPVLVQLTIAQNLQTLSGQLQNAAITIGKAIINAAGTYQTTGPTTALNLKVTTQAASIDELEAVLPALGTATGAGTISAAGALNYNVILKLTGLLGTGNNSGGATAGAGGIAGQLLGMIPSGSGGGAAGAIGGVAGNALRNGIPIAIGGTTSNPTFAPNMSGLISGAAGNAVKGTNPNPS